MQLKAYSIRDAKTEIFNTPFYNNTHGEAERNFKSTINDERSQINKYPEDFDLYFLGEYDTNTGKMSPLDTPQHMVKAINLIETKQ